MWPVRKGGREERENRGSSVFTEGVRSGEYLRATSSGVRSLLSSPETASTYSRRFCRSGVQAEPSWSLIVHPKAAAVVPPASAVSRLSGRASFLNSPRTVARSRRSAFMFTLPQLGLSLLPRVVQIRCLVSPRARREGQQVRRASHACAYTVADVHAGAHGSHRKV